MTRSSSAALAALFVTLALPPVAGCDLLSGDECSADSDCNGDDICDDGECVECENDRDCDDDEECNDGECESADEGEGEEGEGEGLEGEGEEGEGEEGEGEEGEGEGGGCGAVTPQGECDGDVARFCAGEELVEVDCAAAPFDASATICQEINTDYGFDCAVAQGESCIVGPVGEEILTLCQGTEAGCQLDSATTATCVDFTGACSADTVGTCTGTVIVLDCNALLAEGQTDGQPLLLDCADVAGSTCTADVGCLNAPGTPCVVQLSLCGTSIDDAEECPEEGTCPGGAEGEGEGEG